MPSATSDEEESKSFVVQILGVFYNIYSPRCFYFDVVNFAHKISLWGTLVFFGYALFFLARPLGISPDAAGWLYLTVTVTVMLTLGVDLNRNVTMFWIVTCAAGWFWALWLRDVKGIPVIVNTSFNVMGEPIVNTPEDAIRCFLGTGIDLLVIGDHIVEKSE